VQSAVRCAWIAARWGPSAWKKELRGLIAGTALAAGSSVPTCDAQPFQLMVKQPAEQVTPPSRITETYMQIAKERMQKVQRA